MRSKVKNHASRYLTRAMLAGAQRAQATLRKSAEDLVEIKKREPAATIDNRWYIQLPRTHRAA
jgi:hypothetical protein